MLTSGFTEAAVVNGTNRSAGMKPRIASQPAPGENWCNGRAWNLTLMTMTISRNLTELITVRCRSWREAVTVLGNFYRKGQVVR